MQVTSEKYFPVRNNFNNKHAYDNPDCAICREPVFEKPEKIYGHAKNSKATKWHLIDKVCLEALIQDAKAQAIPCPMCRSSIDVSEKVSLIDRITWPIELLFSDFLQGAINGIVFTSAIFGSQVCIAGLGWESKHDQNLRNFRAYCKKMMVPEENRRFQMQLLDPALLDHELQSCLENLYYHFSNVPKYTSSALLIYSPIALSLFERNILVMAACGSLTGLTLYFNGTKPIESSDLPSMFLGTALVGGLSSLVAGCITRFFRWYIRQ